MDGHSFKNDGQLQNPSWGPAYKTGEVGVGVGVRVLKYHDQSFVSRLPYEEFLVKQKNDAINED